MAGTVVWFRQDLRLGDNPAWNAAVRARAPVIPMYIWAPHEEGRWRPGAASRWWLHHSITSLDVELRGQGSLLIIRKGDSLIELREVIAATGADHVVMNRRYEPAAARRDAHVRRELNADGIGVESFNGSLLMDPDGVRTKSGRPFQVFSPFWDACLEQGEPKRPLARPGKPAPPRKWPRSATIESLELLPRRGWAGGIAETWSPGERAARRMLGKFARSALAPYEELRDRPDLPGTSRLSPHLHWGEISPRQVWHAVQDQVHKSSGRKLAGSAAVFLRELGWREFAYHLLHHFPHTPKRPLREKFADVPWQDDHRMLEAWQQGRTGYPLVDAGMRQLWQTGWMHNRVRMVVASFLTKHLMISWQTGSKWFWDTLVDADLANNTLGWQWTAGCGADAAPYFRVFNPISQGRKFDPEGDYVRRWVPELAHRPQRILHEVRREDEEQSLFESGDSDSEYPSPVVQHAEARTRFLSAMSAVKPP